MAKAAMPSLRPTKPIVSLVVALMPICPEVMRRAVAMFSFMAAAWGRILGVSAMRVESILLRVARCSARSSRHLARMSREQMPSMEGSEGGK